MTPPGWTAFLLRWLAPPGRAEEVLGDLEQVHRRRAQDRGRWIASVLTGLEALDLAGALIRGRIRGDVTDDRLQTSEARRALTKLQYGRPSWLDFKLGFRMLLRYPGLTVVAVLAIAFAITVGATNLEYNANFIYPRLPLDEGDRIVEIRNQDISSTVVDLRALHDFVTWRDELRSVQEVGAYQTFRRNLITEQNPASPLVGANMTAAAFGVARVPPLLGRSLSEADEEPGAPNVLVIGFDVWQSHFGGDSDVVGQTVRLGQDPTTIIGVMPEGFGWPWSHDIWAPLRLDVLDFERGESPEIQVIGRLAPTVRLRQAQAELEAIGLGASADHPGTHEHLRPEVVRYGRPPIPFSGLMWAGAYLMTVYVFAGLMLLVCANVTLLLFARTSARESEIAVRSALGASRSRIITQLFAEALVLGGTAAAVGLWGAHVCIRWSVGTLSRVMEDTSGVDQNMLAFWYGDGLSSSTIVWTLIFTVLAAAIAGIVPALRVTGWGVQPHLQLVGTGGSGLQFGRTWTAVIVGQIALTVAFVPLGIGAGLGKAQLEETPYGFPAEEYLSVQLSADGEFYSIADAIRGASRDGFNAQYYAAVTELKRRLADERGAGSVTIVGRIPGADHARRWIEVEGASAPPPTARGHRTQTNTVDLDFFGALGAPIVAGRGFDAADLESGQDVVVVNEEFVRLVLEGRNPIGRWLTFVRPGRGGSRLSEDQPRRYQIVGVVQQIAMTTSTLASPIEAAGIYQLLGPAEEYPLRLAVHVGPDPASFAPRLQELAGEVDPTLQLHQIQPLDQSARNVEAMYTIWFWVLALAGGIAVLLSTAGIFSIMSFTVSRRTREIGVRVALGADRRRIVSAIFLRALKQVGMGIAAGAVLLSFFIFLFRRNFGYRLEPDHLALLAAYLPVMAFVCLCSCIVPMIRAVGVEPTEALRAEG